MLHDYHVIIAELISLITPCLPPMKLKKFHHFLSIFIYIYLLKVTKVPIFNAQNISRYLIFYPVLEIHRISRSPAPLLHLGRSTHLRTVLVTRKVHHPTAQRTYSLMVTLDLIPPDDQRIDHVSLRRRGPISSSN